MMKRLTLSFAFLFVVFQLSGCAHNVKGVVKEVSPGENTLTIAPIDHSGKYPDTIKYQVLKDTAYKGGIVSLTDLHGGEIVKVKTEQDKNERLWKAKKIKLEANPNPAGSVKSQQQTTTVTTSNT